MARPNGQVSGDHCGCLLVALRPRPLFVLASACPDAEFSLGTQQYRPVPLGDWTGFYDWLRNGDGSVIGVRYWPFMDAAPLARLPSQLPLSPYLVAGPNFSFLEIYFSDDRSADRSRSDDQDFGQNTVFTTDDGEWAIAFGTSALSAAELDALSALIASAAPASHRASR